MLPVEFEPTISAGERPQTFTLDRKAIGTSGTYVHVKNLSIYGCWNFIINASHIPKVLSL
jgi:hypothetical protein